MGGEKGLLRAGRLNSSGKATSQTPRDGTSNATIVAPRKVSRAYQEDGRRPIIVLKNKRTSFAI